VALHQIAARQNLSIKYLERISPHCAKAGLVRSVKGAQGGYVLARPADQIRVGDIVQILEGDCLSW
jgi:Rrf2 family protein